MKMNMIRISALLALLLMGSIPAAADVVDPQIIVRGGGVTGTIHVTSPNFTTTIFFDQDPRCTPFTGTIGGQPVPAMTCPVFNQTNSSIFSLTWTIVPAQLPLTFQAQLVNGTFVVNPAQTVLTFYFATPLGPGEDVIIDFLNFAPGTPIGFAVNVPEPAALGMLLTGFGALMAVRSRRRKKEVA